MYHFLTSDFSSSSSQQYNNDNRKWLMKKVCLFYIIKFLSEVPISAKDCIRMSIQSSWRKEKKRKLLWGTAYNEARLIFADVRASQTYYRVRKATKNKGDIQHKVVSRQPDKRTSLSFFICSIYLSLYKSQVCTYKVSETRITSEL